MSLREARLVLAQRVPEAYQQFFVNSGPCPYVARVAIQMAMHLKYGKKAETPR